MAQTEQFGPEDISIIQSRQLRKTVHYIYQRSPFYRDLFDRERIAPSDIKTLDDLRHLPVTGRGDLLREPDRFLCVRPGEVADIMTTSGAAGEPCFFKVTEDDLTRLAYAEQLSGRVAGITDKDVVALALEMDHCFMAGMAMYAGLRRLGATILRLGTIPAKVFMHFLDNTRPTVLAASPAYLKKIVSDAHRMGLTLHRSTIRKIICLDEPIRRQDMMLNDMGAYLRRIWNAELFASFRSTELSASLCECEAGQGGHLHPELVHVEVLDDQGRIMPEGEVGELTITPFGVSAMPVLRYHTGDYTFLMKARCTCGRWTPRLGPILGQRGLRLKAGARTVYPAEVQGIVGGDPDVNLYLLEIADDSRLRLTVDNPQPRIHERLRNKILEELGLAVAVTYGERKKIAVLQKQDTYYKPRCVFDFRNAT